MAKAKRDKTAYMATMRDRFEAARKGWETVRKDFREDLRYVCGEPSLQWDSNVKGNRDDDGIPTLTMDRLNPLVNSIVAQARKDRPTPKVEPGDDGDQQTADAIEGKVRHVLHVSHADVALDCAEAYCASGGWGFYKLIKDYTGKHTTNQEPRVKRISDPMMEYPDPGVEEPDFSDAGYWFSRKKYRRDEFRAEFSVDPMPFGFPDDPQGNWSRDEDTVYVAEYFWVEEVPHEYHVLADGRRGVAEDLAAQQPYTEEEVIQARQVKERIIHCDIVDGEKPIEEAIWEGEWIPRFVLTGNERIYEGKRRYVSAVRYERDPQGFVNAAYSYTADRLATINVAPYVGWTGSFRDRKWRDGKRHFYLEAAPPTDPNTPKELPVPNVREPAIQGSTQATLQGIDAINGAMGRVDSVTRPSQADLSGVAVERRDDQANLANSQYENSLKQSMWHFGRALVDLLVVLADTPRVWQTRKEDGRQKPVPVTMNVDPRYSPYVPGYAPEHHINIDQGDYIIVVPNTSYTTQNDEEAAFLEGLFQRQPQLFALYGDLYFRKRGWSDFEERAKLTLPPQLQQAIATQDGQGPNPQMMAQQLAQANAQNQQYKQVLQQVLMKLQTRAIETQGKLDVEKLKTIRALIEQATQHQHEGSMALTGHSVDAAAHMLDLLHTTELAPTPDTGNPGMHPVAPPEPAQGGAKPQ